MSNILNDFGSYRTSFIVREDRNQAATLPTDPWTTRARPVFLYVIYALILWSIPIGLVAAADPQLANAIAGAMTTYLRGIPDDLYALFGTGYLGYTAARTFGKLKGVEK